MSFHGKVGEAWADWLAGYQRVYPSVIPEEAHQSERCGAKPPPDLLCPQIGIRHGESPTCECVLFTGRHSRHVHHRALCGAVWGA